MSATQHPVLTIGHSNHSLEAFLELLRTHGIDEVADVRSSPYSRYTPHFGHRVLSEALESAGIGYAFLGGELGGRPRDRSCYDAEGRVRYDRLAESDEFDDGIRQIVHGADERRIVLMCAEKEPLDCHRTLLVARALVDREVDVAHIHADGSLEEHAAAMDRLVSLHKLSPVQQIEMFAMEGPDNGGTPRSRDDLIADAMARQTAKVAYVGAESTVGGDDWENGS
ncbi:MAG: DUF488 domain-containing protein [Chloroflexi bacterium]|nr:DUF488 domain-containing protein [Chloroflexota bacterium]